jgi:alpha-L-fucosidase
VTLSRRSLIAAGLGAAATSLLQRLPVQPGAPRPSRSQLLWQRDELALFLHFGVNTFTNREWGDGREDPAIFAPTNLDANQWASVAKETGFRTIVLTAKHHDGFCLWPTKTTTHSVASSPFRGGKGDVVREMVDACHKQGLRVGLYCSPWDRNHPAYGDSDRYNIVFREQLTELLGGYGEIHEVWFDGANGEGPNGKRQVYDWPRTFSHVRRLQPDAVIFSDAGPDVRWIGNERGVAGETNWSTIISSAVPYPGADGAGIVDALQQGHSYGDVWRPGETDVSIRPGWFYHPAEDARVKSVDDLVNIFFSSVGRNSKLLLNVPPTREGRLHSVDVERLRGMRRALDSLFDARRAAHVRPGAWRPILGGSFGTNRRNSEVEATVDAPGPIATIDLREAIEQGQRVARWTLEFDSENGWREVASGTTIGYRALRRISPVPAKRLRMRILDSNADPMPVDIRLYSSPA